MRKCVVIYRPITAFGIETDRPAGYLAPNNFHTNANFRIKDRGGLRLDLGERILRERCAAVIFRREHAQNRMQGLYVSRTSSTKLPSVLTRPR